MKGRRAALEMTTLELSVAIALWSSPDRSAATLAARMEGWFGTEVPAGAVAQALAAFQRRGWIATRRGRELVLTRRGVAVTLTAFNGFVRQIDGGRSLWQAGLMWSLVGQGGPDETRH